MKVDGEGEWKVRTHGVEKRRTWRKLPLAMDAATDQITALSVTDKDELDRHLLPALLDQTAAEIEAVCADGAYDFEQCYRAIKKREARALIPPRQDAVVRGKSPFERRDETVRQIKAQGRREWKQESGYHRRSLIECGIYRVKMIFDERLRSRLMETQTTEARIRCEALNRMTRLGMPQSYAI